MSADHLSTAPPSASAADSNGPTGHPFVAPDQLGLPDSRDMAELGSPVDLADVCPAPRDADDPEWWADSTWPEPSTAGPSELSLDDPFSRAPECFPSAQLVARAADGELALPDLVATLDALGRAELALLDADGRIDAVRAWERLCAVVAARQQDAIASVADATEDLGLDPVDARHEIGAALRLSPLTADQRTRVALAVRDRLPRTRALLRTGEISWRHASNLVEVIDHLPQSTVDAVEARLAPRLPHMTAAETRRAARDLLVHLDPQAAAEKLAEGHDTRRVERLDQADGTRSWWFPMEPETEHNMWSALTRRAKATKRALRNAGLPDPGLDALRVDSIVDLVLGRPSHVATDVAAVDVAADAAEAGAAEAAPAGTLATTPIPSAAAADSAFAEVPRCSCGGAEVAAIVLDLPTALGLADNPGRLTGYGAVPGPLARSMAKDRDWVRFITDPLSGHLLDRGDETYRPSAALRAFIIARDQACGFPGCNRPAKACDCDHVINHRLPDGRTIRINLGPLCRQHHNAKTHGRWRLHYDPKAKVKTWTSPLGRRYTKGTDPPLP